MQSFISHLTRFNEFINAFVWGPVMLVIFLLIGAMFTCRTKFFQILHIRLWLRETLISIFTKRQVTTTTDRHAISQFQALTTALAGTVGTGNIAGVASALAIGGPGAIFWMWLSAFLGMMTGFAEKSLGIKYRYKNAQGDWVGGAMIYIERGLGCKWLAIAFSCFCILASFGIGNMTQINSISSAMHDSFGIPTWLTGLLGAQLVALVLLGGIQRIGRVTEKLVPFMVILYLIGGLVCILKNIEFVPSAFSLILTEAFTPRSAAGGAVGYGLMTAMRKGISRGVFSNEAGLGSSVIAHAAADVKEPVVQGMWGIFEVFVDTLVMCTMTALIILTSGVYDMGAYLSALSIDQSVVEGAVLTSNAVAVTLGTGGKYFIAVALALFAFSTLLGWSYYGERSVDYVFGSKAIPLYRLLFIFVVFIGAVSHLSLVWDISDTFNGLMAIPNLIALVLLSSEVIAMLRDYQNRHSIKRINK